MKRNSICGEGEFTQAIRAEATDLLHQWDDVAANRGLTASKTDLCDALRNKERGQVEDLGGGEHVRGR
jgi:hypothetical protein